MSTDTQPVEVKAADKPVKKGVPTVQVVPLSRRGGLTLVEWVDEHGYLHRNWVKDEIVEVTSEGTQVADPGSGVPYGFDFARMLGNKLKTTPQAIDNELKRVGIWTAEDLRTHTAEARAALLSAYGVDVATLLEAVMAWEREQNQSPNVSGN